MISILFSISFEYFGRTSISWLHQNIKSSSASTVFDLAPLPYKMTDFS